MSRSVEKGRVERDEMRAAFERMSFVTDLAGSALGTDYVIEAAVEKLDVKREIFAELDEVVPEHTVLATNSSTIDSSQLVCARKRAGRICNMHFFTLAHRVRPRPVGSGRPCDPRESLMDYKLRAVREAPL